MKGQRGLPVQEQDVGPGGLGHWTMILCRYGMLVPVCRARKRSVDRTTTIYAMLRGHWLRRPGCGRRWGRAQPVHQG
jgi:hypothetical protein